MPLSKKLKKILDKYDWSLKFISPQQFNFNVQKVCKIAGFGEANQVDTIYGNKKNQKTCQNGSLGEAIPQEEHL